MTADKYLQNRSRYYEDYPRVRTFNSTSSPYEQRLRERQIQRAQKQQRRRPVQNTLQRRKAPNLVYLNKESKRIHSSSQNILKGMTDILSLVTLGALTLLGLSKYIDAKESSFSPEYAPEGTYSGASTGHMSPEGKAQLKSDEGCVLYTYDDKGPMKNGKHVPFMPGDKKKGTLTIGYGHTGSDVKPGMTITQAQADALFEKDIVRYEDIVKKQLRQKGITTPLSQRQFDAMVNYAYNAGSLGDKFLTKLKAGDYQGASYELEVGGQNAARMGRLQEAFRADVTPENKLKSDVAAIGGAIKSTGAGKIRQFKNSTKVGDYVMSNPNKKRDYIELSERAEAYLHDVGGKGRITSGAEGSHALGNMSHASGNKIDVSAYNLNDDNEWADVAIPFLKNKNTAFVCFEDFSKTRFERIQKIIYSKIDANLKAKCDSKGKYGWGDRGGCFLDYKANYGTGLHLDIGILPNAYSKNAYKQEQKDSKNNVKVEQNNEAMKNNKKPVSTTPKPVKTEQSQPTIVLQTQAERVNPTIDLNKINKKNKGNKKGNS